MGSFFEIKICIIKKNLFKHWDNLDDKWYAPWVGHWRNFDEGNTRSHQPNEMKASFESRGEFHAGFA